MFVIALGEKIMMALVSVPHSLRKRHFMSRFVRPPRFFLGGIICPGCLGYSSPRLPARRSLCSARPGGLAPAAVASVAAAAAVVVVWGGRGERFSTGQKRHEKTTPGYKYLSGLA